MSSSAPPDPIGQFLRVVRAALERRQAVGGASAWTALALTLPLGVLVGAGAFGSGAVWRPLGWLALLGLGGWAAIELLRRNRRFASDELVARFVGTRLPQVGGDLLSAVEFEREPPPVERTSPVLIGAHRRRVVARLSTVEPRGLVDMRPARSRGALRVGAALLVWLLALAFCPGALRRGWSELRRTPGETAATSAEPILGDLDIELHYPSYTGLPDRAIPGSSGQVLALAGTEVRLSARALVPVRSAELFLEEEGAKSPKAHAVRVGDGGALSTRFVVSHSGRYHFVLSGSGGRVREPEAHRVDIEPDHPPRVDLFAPAEPLEVAGPRRVELGYSVDDDYGLGDLELVYRIGDSPEQRKMIAPAAASGTARPPRSGAGKFEWDLAELDLKPGARVAYHLEAKDNDNVPAPNVGVSRTLHLAMSSPREKEEAALAAEEALLEQALALLADRLEVKRGTDPELAEPFGRLHLAAEALLQALARAERAAESHADRAKQLREMHARLAKLTADEEVLLAELKRRRGPGRGRHALETVNLKQVAELERDAIALDDLLGRQRLEELLAVGDEMTQTRDRLRSLMEKYQQSHSDALRKDIERELHDLERRLAELNAKAAKLAAELPDQFLNSEAMGKNDLKERLDRIREQMARGDVAAAMAELERMSKSLDDLVASMESDLRGFRRERFTAEDKAMAELESELSDLAHDEKGLSEETEAVRQRTRAEAQRLLRDKIQPLAKRARDKVAQLKKQLDAVEPGAVPPYDLEELQRVKQHAAELEKMLGAGDVDEARHAARDASHGLGAIGSDLRQEEARQWRGPAAQKTKRSREHVDEGEKLARQIADELDKAMPQPGDLMSADDKKRMSELAERQQTARRRAQELERELGRKPGEAERPLSLPPQIQQGLREAGDHMERAKGQLDQRDARDAAGEEAQALDRLSKMQEQLSRERRPREQRSGGRLDRETVKIPGADEYRAPKEFRQDLLEAMKRGAPAQYQEQVKRYYEELVK